MHTKMCAYASTAARHYLNHTFPYNVCLLVGRRVDVFEHPSHQVEASGDKDVNRGCLTNGGGFGCYTGFDWYDGLDWACQDRVPSLGDPLESAEDAGEDQGVRFILQYQGQAILNEQRCARVIPHVVVKTPAPLVVQAAGQHVLHRNIEILLV